jgi:hypothetical protein
MCDGVAGWIEFKEGNLETKVTFGTRLRAKAPFGVVSTRMLFEVKGDGPSPGKGAQSALPEYK